MKSAAVLLVVLLSIICVTHCKDLIVGSIFNNTLIHQQKVKYEAIPHEKRVEEVFFSDPGQQIIKGIIMRDLDNSYAIPRVTGGGVGSSYVNTLKSERGSGLNYQVEIYG